MAESHAPADDIIHDLTGATIGLAGAGAWLKAVGLHRAWTGHAPRNGLGCTRGLTGPYRIRPTKRRTQCLPTQLSC